ncbi:MAG: hypothetical protein EBS61_06020, partial [Betaproteobacteria bacterium]|nr:hypothetical protein [Betaproteobacteria bacterium]
FRPCRIAYIGTIVFNLTHKKAPLSSAITTIWYKTFWFHDGEKDYRLVPTSANSVLGKLPINKQKPSLSGGVYIAFITKQSVLRKTLCFVL